MLKRALQSLYLKMFLSFLAICVLIFIGLAVFWNQFLYQSYSKDKRDFMVRREGELEKIYQMYFDGTLETRELRISLRILARSLNGEAWIVDDSGRVLLGSDTGSEGKRAPAELNGVLGEVLKGKRGFATIHLRTSDNAPYANYMTYYAAYKVNGHIVGLFLFAPIGDIQSAFFAIRWTIWVSLLFSLLAVGMMLFLLSRRFAGPLQQMNRMAHAIAEGDFTIRVPVRGHDEVGQLAESFNGMLDKLQQWEDTRQEFLTNVSHELRSPLTSLRGLITGMADGVISPAQQPRYLAICIDEVKRLERLVSELLDLARIQNSSEAFRPELIDAVRTAQETIDLVAPMIESKGLELRVWIPDDAAPAIRVRLDPDRFAQILNNLLYNAIQFTSEGQSIQVYMGTDDREFVLKVADTGIGMTEEELRRIWDRFYKADPSRGIRPEGTGLGLTIVQQLVQRMSGSIQVSSAVGEGTTFTVRFPLAERSPHALE